MSVDEPLLHGIVTSLYAARVQSEYGATGLDVMMDVLKVAESIFEVVPFEGFRKGLTIFREVDTCAIDLSAPDALLDINLSAKDVLADGCFLHVRADGRCGMWSSPPASQEDLSVHGLVYVFTDGDYLFIRGEAVAIPKFTQYPTAIGVPTFAQLDEALESYDKAMSRHSTCKFLKTVWADDQATLLVNKPESIMRESLAQHLRSRLAGHRLIEVREEQVVDESKPVDLKITWSFSNRIALIEIKWLGQSVSADGTKLATPYAAARAREGAEQLAHYLNSNAERAPMHVTRGYLVVYDARRKGPGIGKQLSREDALAFRNKDLSFDPDYHLERDDFAPPVRLFLEPRQIA